MRMRPKTICTALILAFAVLMTSALYAEQEKAQDVKKAQGPPPAIVVVKEATSGVAKPMKEFVGTVFYSHVSEIASEVAGKVSEVNYNEGHRVDKGQTLVTLGSDILSANVDGARATYEQAQVELERARKDLARMEVLYKAESIAESLFDEHSFRVQSLQKNADSLKASLKRLTLQMEMTSIKAGFTGIVVKRTVEPGEWVSAGGTVAVVADDSVVNVIVDVPAKTLDHMKRGQKIDVLTKGKRLSGTFTGFIPKGDVATRTFSIKVRFKNTVGLIEGMEARAILPVGPGFEGILVSRDAVINKYGRDVVFAMVDGAAKMIPVSVLGYHGMQASVTGPGLESGMQIVVKGNERIRDAQPLRVASGEEK